MGRASVVRGIILAAACAMLLGLAAACAPQQKPGAPYHHTTSGFRNPPGSVERNPWFRRVPWILNRLIGGRENWDAEFPDDHVVPQAEALSAFKVMQGEDTLTWIGHMTALIRLDGVTVLTDPWFTEFASPIPPYGPRRYVAPGISTGDLPPIDVVVISHNHYDHLDLPTLDLLPNKDGITAIVPLGLGHYFEERSYGTVIELDWYDSAMVNALTITALPVIHWSKRSFFKTNDTLWAGFAIEGSDNKGSQRKRLYFGGDAEYGPIYKEMGKSYDGFDLAIISIGAYLPRKVMNGAHCVPETCFQLGLDLGAHTLLGIHWGTVRLGDDGFDDPPKGFVAAGRQAGIPDDRVWIMRIGETRILPRRPN